MSVQSATSRADYTGNGTTTTFSVPFYFIQNEHVKLLLTTIATGAFTALALGSDYTLSGAGNEAGGSATLTIPPTAQQRLTILRNVPYEQLFRYIPNDPFPAASHEMALDYLTMLIQQLGNSLSPQICVATVPGSVYTAPGVVAAVFVNGLIQPTTAYSAVGNTITFNYSLDLGDTVYAFCTSY